jgi:hypothetical protein
MPNQVWAMAVAIISPIAALRSARALRTNSLYVSI